MQNSKTNPAKPASQPQLPFNDAPINWLEPVECKFGQLAAVTAAAKRAGFVPVRMACIAGGYKVTCQRMAEADAPQPTAEAAAHGLQGGRPPEKSKDSFLKPN